MKAKEVLDDELRKARLGPLYRPNAALRELVDAFLAQYRGAPSTKDRRRYYLAKATAEFGSNTLDSLTALDVARWRAALPETTRHGSHQALRQVSAAAVKWQWIERNVATDVSNPLHERVELRPVESWEEIEALAHELGPFGGPTAPALPRPAPLVPQSRDPGVRPRLGQGVPGPRPDHDDRALPARSGRGATTRRG